MPVRFAKADPNEQNDTCSSHQLQSSAESNVYMIKGVRQLPATVEHGHRLIAVILDNADLSAVAETEPLFHPLHHSTATIGTSCPHNGL